jgi:Mrp family chromosome partitioning ATPase
MDDPHVPADFLQFQRLLGRGILIDLGRAAGAIHIGGFAKISDQVVLRWRPSPTLSTQTIEEKENFF